MGSQAHSKFVIETDNLFDECESFSKLHAEDLTESLVEAKLESLEEDWKTIRTSYEAIYSAADSLISPEFKELSRTRFRECREKYQLTKASMNDLLKAAKSPPTVQTDPYHSSTLGGSSFYPMNTTFDLSEVGLRVPACDIKVFNGSYEEWPAFRDMFSVLYHTNPRVSQVEKFFHLLNKTSGDALAIVRKFSLSEQNYMPAWNALKSRYENKKFLVEIQMKTLFNLEPAKSENSVDINRIRTTICDCLSMLIGHGIRVDQWDPILVYLCSTKLSIQTITAWEESLESDSDLPSWHQMDTFLKSRHRVLERIEMARDQMSANESSHKGDQKPGTSKNIKKRTDTNSQNLCVFCNENHYLRNCRKFSDLTVKQRVDFVEQNKICTNCLSPTHLNQDCRSIFRCTQCKNKHHSLLHVNHNINNELVSRANRPVNSFHTEYTHPVKSMETENNGPEKQCPSCSKHDQINVQTHLSVNDDNILLPTALVQINHLGDKFSIRALIDSASKRSFLTERIRNRLNLKTEPADFEICGLGGTVVSNSKKICNVTLCAEKHNFILDTQAIIVSNLTSLMPSTTISNPNLDEISELELADPKFYVSSQVDMLLGSDILPYILLEGTRQHVLGNMVAQNSVYGWFVYGPFKINSLSLVTVDINEKTRESNEICVQLRKFWETEEIFNSSVLSEEDKFCEKLFAKTTFRRKDGRYVVKLPFRSEFPEIINLSSSRYQAKKQYLHMEANLAKKSNLLDIYNNILKEYIDLGHMKKCNSTEIEEHGKYYSYYLPHHAVFRPESASTKVRVVFNGSRKTQSSYSLNDILYSGPTLQSDLMTIILNWRKYEYVFNGDIEKMYRQIMINESDRPYQRILFRNVTTGNIEDYELTTVTFGINCAPYLAIRTLLQLADESETLNPLASLILRNETYVDDVLSGGHTLESAIESQKQLCTALNSAGFPLRKITANHHRLLEHIPKENLLNDDLLKFNDSSSTKTLGICWNAMSDTFNYKVESISLGSTVTKRQILSCIAKLFDPAGWLTPIIIEAKMLLQNLWQDGVEWDENVNSHIFQKWKLFIDNFHHIDRIQIPRWVNFQPENYIQLHGFCDASERAYCAAVYLRSENPNRRSTHLLVAKSKVAPLKKLSLPRLELCGALLLSKLVRQLLCDNLFPNTSVYLWTDSTIVLAWLQKHPSTWKTFVANRISKIIENVVDATWRHVPTSENPADLGTRGCKPQDLVNNPLWWHGPLWLLSSQDHWPMFSQPLQDAPDQRKICLIACSTDPAPSSSFKNKGTVLKQPSRSQVPSAIAESGEELSIINSFSRYHRALRVIAYVYRFYNLASKKVTTFPETITQNELNNSKVVLIRLTQRTYYFYEYNDLSNSRAISKKSSLITLNPFLDSNGLLRVNGRLVNSSMSYDERFPIIIPYKSNLCEMILKFIHQNLMHADVSLMLSMVRYQFYIPALKRAVKKCINKCLTCVRYKQRVLSQIMAALPAERTTFSLPFTFTGVDFAGPFQIKAGHLRNSPYMKGYACIFVCFATRAIHLEPCSNLSSEAFLATFDRFVGRRGLPKRLMSDNGTNFVGASKTLLAEYAMFLEQSYRDIVEKYAIHGFEWKFIPPSAPHMGGLWEAGVKSFKLHFRKVVGNHKFNFEEFSTLLIRIEGVLNSRPLSPMTEDPKDLEVLTPGHFLRGSPLMAPPEMPNDDLNMSLLNRWEKLKALHHRFAQRWKTEYLQELHKRYKWRYPKKELIVGDFVIIKDELLPPSDWRLGRIETIYLGSDKRVRVADIRTQYGLVTRPIVKLCWLPILDK
ncbi:uncharacterized protein LOC119609586 [Lucilia sericata]|uniref:uncharacterized protein LOC119609586 n=2 Tax=Lucilia sericata TaxID=13632 RepID=UPI0018A87590|nr:uncharacterized protein LOC119609586 [Lucilia sericata]